MTTPSRLQDESGLTLTRTRSFLAFIAAIAFAIRMVAGQETVAGTKAVPLPGKAAVAVARERAKLLHDVYSTTLDVMHHRYFHRDGPVLPARRMEDVFEEIAGLSGIYANWISVNAKAMSINHDPSTEFEKKAAPELASGKKEYKFVGKAVYRRAAVIPLRSSCVGFHTRMFAKLPDTPRYSGLVISIPLRVEKK